MTSCPDCKKGKIILGEPSGTMLNSAYFAAGPEGRTSRAIILLTDIFGLSIANCKIIADNLSKRLACDVWVPDLFNGKPPIPADKLQIVPRRVGERVNWISFLFRALPYLPRMFRNRTSVVYPRVETFVKNLKTEKKYGRLGVVGYCFGGTLGVMMASTDLLNTVVICHPGPIADQQVQAIKIPSSWACAEDDIHFRLQNRRKAEELLASRIGKDNYVEYEFKDYKGTVHGFAARPNLDNPEAKAGHEGSFEQTVEWLEKTLPVN